jgi:pimeloyl-ACP methyl ester carboxylesterase
VSTALDPTGRAVQVGAFKLRTPGLSGAASAHAPGSPGMRAAELATPDLDASLERAGLRTQATLEIERAAPVATAQPPLTRGTSVAEPAIDLEVAAPSPGWGQMVLATDESGVATWSFAPEAATRRYLVRSTIPAPDGEAGDHRGLIGALGKKVLKVVAFRLVEEVLGEVGERFAKRWEERHRPYTLRTFGLDGGHPAEPVDWARVGEGRALVFLHGTFSTARAGFGLLPSELMRALHESYGGRVLAFDHFTLSEDPRANAEVLHRLLPERARLDVDVVAHSRGGLLARVLAEKAGDLSTGGREIRVGRLVLVGTPNNGTMLADADRMGDLVDTYTSLLNFLPDNGVTEVLDAVITVTKLLAVGVTKGLDGLQAMVPGGPFLADWLNTGDAAADARYHAVTSNFEPVQRGLKDFARDRLTDGIFGAENDLVVPTEGVFAANGCAHFPVADPLVLDARAGVGHNRYFADPAVHAKLKEWLA